MKSLQTIIVILLLIVFASGCSTWNKLSGTEKGAVAGGTGGALIGGATGNGLGGTLIGGAAGAGVGALVGHEMDENRRRR